MGQLKEWIKRIPLVGTLGRWCVGCLRLPFRALDLVERVNRIEVAVDRIETTVRGHGRIVANLADNTALAHVQGLKVFLDTRDRSVTPHLLLDGEWESWVTKVFLKTLREGMTVVDVGANVGYYTLLAARAVGPHGKVFGFEPEPRNFELMRRSVEANGFNAWTTLSSKAVADRAGATQLHIFVDGYGASHSLFAELVPGAKRHIPVETISLDDFFAGGTRIDLVKLDAEGAEAAIWRGMKRILEENPHITFFLEFASGHLRAAGENPASFLQDMRRAGFPLRRISFTGKVVDADEKDVLESAFETLFLRREM